MEVVAGWAGAPGGTSAKLQRCLGSMLTAAERSAGFAEGVVMSFDPDVLLPNAFAASVERGLDDALLAWSVRGGIGRSRTTPVSIRRPWPGGSGSVSVGLVRCQQTG